MVNALTPGYLRWDGTKIISDTDISVAGPTGPIGPMGPAGVGPTGPTGATGPAATFSGTSSDLTAGDGSVVSVDPIGSTGLVLSGGTLSVNLSFKPTDILGVREKFFNLTGATGTVTHNCSNGQIFYHQSIVSDFTANIFRLYLSGKFGTSIILVLNQGATAYLPTALQIDSVAQTIKWQGASPPSGTANQIDIVTFSILNTGTTSAPVYLVFGQLTTFG